MKRAAHLGLLEAALLTAGCESATAPTAPAVDVPEPSFAVTTNDPRAAFDFLVTTCEEDVYGVGRLHAPSTETISADQDTLVAPREAGVSVRESRGKAGRQLGDDALDLPPPPHAAGRDRGRSDPEPTPSVRQRGEAGRAPHGSPPARPPAPPRGDVARRGQGPALVQKAMGRSDLATTMGYAHLLDHDPLALVADDEERAPRALAEG